jgi:hypothetical protein
VAFDNTAPAIAENDPAGLAYLSVTRSSAVGAASVDVVLQSSSTAVAGTHFALDYAGSPFVGNPARYTLRFANGEATTAFGVRVLDVAGYFGDKTAVFALQNPVDLLLGAASSAALTIRDKDSPPPPGDYDINGHLIPATPTHATPGAAMCENFSNPGVTPYAPSPGLGGSQPCGAYRIPVSGTAYDCSAHRSGAEAVNNAFLYVLEDYESSSLRLGNTINWGMVNDAAMVFKFKTGPVGSFSYLPRDAAFAFGEAYNRGPVALSTFMTLSESKCDFNVSKVGTNACYVMIGNSGSMQVTTNATAVPPNAGRCQLKPDTTYYLNIRYDGAAATPDPLDAYARSKSCSAAYCGQYITIN